MKCLAFSRESVTIEGRRVRAARFEERSSLPVSAACVVANGVREALARAFDADASLRLLEPVIPSPAAWAAIARDGVCFRLRGPLADAAIVLGRRDAVALATSAFGVGSPEDRVLSPIERAVLERTLASIAGAFAPVCGFRGEAPRPEPLGGLAGFTTYFELVLDRPAALRVGVGLSREPDAAVGPPLRLEDLLDLEVELTGSFGATMTAAQVAALEVGTIVPITEEKVLRGTVALAGSQLGRGECGVRAGRYAVVINEGC